MSSRHRHKHHHQHELAVKTEERLTLGQRMMGWFDTIFASKKDDKDASSSWMAPSKFGEDERTKREARPGQDMDEKADDDKKKRKKVPSKFDDEDKEEKKDEEKKEAASAPAAAAQGAPASATVISSAAPAPATYPRGPVPEDKDDDDHKHEMIADGSGKYKCSKCGYIYDPAANENKSFTELPADWKCPQCASPKTVFVSVKATTTTTVPKTTTTVAQAQVTEDMPGDSLEAFGREDTAQELTDSSVTESNAMIDQLERAEVAEEKRSVFRALTRLRGVAISGFDGIAKSQTNNIANYAAQNSWREKHPIKMLAEEESDYTTWAFPKNADF
eukprot:TRINITY_DN2053_c0_g1_i1.p1 TRINITY_DN2053_c0_g1~~TRINITY_DN2053_c0_g1_i1.p1  ORF type:complete len:378 (+),score=104.30 TRINITY_DN2053_c0_g1_i1:139-1134(+)